MHLSALGQHKNKLGEKSKQTSKKTTTVMVIVTVTGNNSVNNFKPLSKIIDVNVVCQIFAACILTLIMSILGLQIAEYLFNIISFLWTSFDRTDCFDWALQHSNLCFISI